jgi:hypothetical protein
MTSEFFAKQTDRLRGLWPHAYPAERVTMLFNAIKSMPDFWMEQTTNSFIANARRPPLLQEFLEKIGEYEDRKKRDEIGTRWGSGSMAPIGRELEKLAARSPNKEFAKECVKLLNQKIKRKISDQEFEQGVALLEKAAKQYSGICIICNGEGYALTAGEGGSRYLSRCSCQLGQRRPEKAFGPLRQDGTREEIHIPILRHPR